MPSPLKKRPEVSGDESFLFRLTSEEKVQRAEVIWGVSGNQVEVFVKVLRLQHGQNFTFNIGEERRVNLYGNKDEITMQLNRKDLGEGMVEHHLDIAGTILVPSDEIQQIMVAAQ